MHLYLEVVGFHLMASLLKIVMILSDHNHPASAPALGALLLKGALITKFCPFKPVIYLAGLLIPQPAALATLVPGGTDGFTIRDLYSKLPGREELLARSIQRRPSRPHQNSSLLPRFGQCVINNISRIHIQFVGHILTMFALVVFHPPSTIEITGDRLGSRYFGKELFGRFTFILGLLGIAMLFAAAVFFRYGEYEPLLRRMVVHKHAVTTRIICAAGLLVAVLMIRVALRDPWL